MTSTKLEKGFYVTLPSNASRDVFPDNTISNFRVKLYKRIDLGESVNYEVALVGIQYPHRWNTLDDSSNSIHYIDRNRQKRSVRIPTGSYHDVIELVEQTNAKLSEDEQHPTIRFHYNSGTRRVDLVQSDSEHVELDQNLALILGMPNGVITTEKLSAAKDADIHKGFYSLYVYCNLCDAQFVGDAHVSLLQTVPISGKNGDMITHTYSTPHYVPVKFRSFDVIEIDIKDDFDQSVSFTSGKVICKLHFRPI